MTTSKGPKDPNPKDNTIRRDAAQHPHDPLPGTSPVPPPPPQDDPDGPHVEHVVFTDTATQVQASELPAEVGEDQHTGSWQHDED